MAEDRAWQGLTDQGCDGRGEDRAALHHKGHPSTHDHCEVPSKPAEWVRKVCHGMTTGTGVDTSMEMGMDTSAGSSRKLLYGAGEEAAGPGSGYGLGKAVSMGPAWWLVARMAEEGGHGHQETMKP